MPQTIHDTTSDGSFTGADGDPPDPDLWRVGLDGEATNRVELDGAGACEMYSETQGSYPQLWPLDPNTGDDYARDAGEWLANIEWVSGSNRWWMFLRRIDSVGTDVFEVRFKQNLGEWELYQDDVEVASDGSFGIQNEGEQIWVRHNWATDLFQFKAWTGTEGSEPGAWDYEDTTGATGGENPLFHLITSFGSSGLWKVNQSTLVDPEGTEPGGGGGSAAGVQFVI